MRVLLFGASGMVGQGVLRECLRSRHVERVVCVVRQPLEEAHAKLEQVARHDVADLSGVDLAAFDACFFPLGVSSVGMDEASYRKVTQELTLAIARQLHAANPGMAFVYVSGRGTDTKGRAMWARVKGETEDALLALFPKAFMFRPGVIQPLDGIKSRTPVYNAIYVVMRPFVALAARRSKSILTTRFVGQAMVGVALRGFPKRVLEPEDIRAAAALAE